MPVLPSHRPITIAHRAANDLERLRRAEALGVDFLECDVWLYQGRMEIRHEKTLGPLPIRWDRWSLEWKGPPRLVLHQLLDAWQGPGALLLDLKGTNNDLSAEVIRAIGDASQDVPFAVTARSPALLRPFTEMPEVSTFPSAGRIRDIDRLTTEGTRTEWSGIAVHRRLLSHDLVSRLHQVAPIVTTWPINAIETLERVLSFGVDGITSDNLDVLAHAHDTRTAT